MTTITKEDFITWKNSDVTRAVFDAIRLKEKEAIEALISSNNEVLRGFIVAYRDILNVEFEDMEEE